MTALEFYANATKYVMREHELSDSYLMLLQEALSPLRFFMACRVCNQILKSPMSPDHTVCQHTVCLRCVGGKMRLKPSCGWCQKYENFVENKSLKSLILCYAKLCEYIQNSHQYHAQLQYASSRPEIQGCKEKVATLLKEGCDVNQATTTTSQLNIKPPFHTYIHRTSTITTEPTNQQTDSVPNTLRVDTKLKLVTPASMENIIQPDCSNNKRRRHPTDPVTTSSPAAKKRSLLTKAPPRSRTVTGSLSESSMLSSDGEISQPEHSPIRVKKVSILHGTEELKIDESEEVEGDGMKKRVKRVDRNKIEKKGCGCGNAASTPGKLTCYGQRCPCYSSHNPCLDCRCKGCRNPNKVVKIEQASEDTDGDEINVE